MNRDQAEARFNDIKSIFSLEEGDPEVISHEFGWLEIIERAAKRDIGGNRVMSVALHQIDDGEWIAGVDIYCLNEENINLSHETEVGTVTLDIDILSFL